MANRRLEDTIRRLEKRATATRAKDTTFIARYWAMELSTEEIAHWLKAQSWQRAHRATLAAAAQWEQESIRQNLSVDRSSTNLETTAMVIAATPLGTAPPADAVEQLERACRVPEPEPPKPPRRWPGRVLYERPRWFAGSVFRLQLGGLGGLPLRQDIDRGCYPISNSTWKPCAWYWLNPTLWFPIPGGEALFAVPQVGRRLPDGELVRAYSPEDLNMRFTAEEAKKWPP